MRKARLGLQSRRPTVGSLTGDDISDQSAATGRHTGTARAGGPDSTSRAELPDRLRESMALIYFEGYDSEAAARFLDVPAGTLRRRLHDGRRQLRTPSNRFFKGAGE